MSICRLPFAVCHRRLGRQGQYMPITALVMFTTVVFLVAVTNIYKVTRAKLKVQNLADAVALNIASQMASSMNKTSDMNEWMNHFIDPGPNAQPSTPGQAPNCAGITPDLPPLACAENATQSTSLNRFSRKGNAANYAVMVQTINKAQQLFIDTYNNFIGAGVASNSSISSRSNLNSILLADIPELGEAGTYVSVWNTQPSGPAQASPPNGATTPLDTSGVQPLKFQVHDIPVTFRNFVNAGPFGSQELPSVSMTLGQLLAGNNQPVTPVGWMVPDPNQPSIDVGPGKSRIGAGAKVSRYVQVPILGNILVSAQAQAYVVEGSGTMGTQAEMLPDPSTGVLRPVFKPTYWIKLAGVQQ
jgi:hypothetical protein